MAKSADHLAAKIRDEIASGILAEGDKLPSISDYIEEGYGRGVSQSALNKLRAEGVITARHGAGYYVAKQFARIQRRSPARLASKQWGSGKAIQDNDTAGRWRSVDVRVFEVPAPDFAAAELGVERPLSVLCRSRSFEVDGRRVQLADSYIPLDLAQGTPIVYTDTGPGGVFARLAEKGFAPTRFSERIVGRSPKPDEDERLDLRRGGAMVFEVTRVAWAGERAVDVTRMVLDAEAYELVYDFPA